MIINYSPSAQLLDVLVQAQGAELHFVLNKERTAPRAHGDGLPNSLLRGAGLTQRTNPDFARTFNFLLTCAENNFCAPWKAMQKIFLESAKIKELFKFDKYAKVTI